MKIHNWALLCFFIILFNFTCPAQEQISSLSGNYDQLKKRADQILFSSLYPRGYVFVNKYPALRGSPFLDIEPNGIFSIEFSDHTVKDIPFKYDIFNDEVMYQYFTSEGPVLVAITKAFVRQFTLGSIHFVNLSDSVDGYRTPGAGYYQELINGKVSLFIKHQKVASGVSGPGLSYVERKTIFLVRDNNWYKIRNYRSALDVMLDEKEKMLVYIEKNNLRGNLKIEGLQQMVHFFNELKRSEN